jgi:hypothetical protein
MWRCRAGFDIPRCECGPARSVTIQRNGWPTCATAGLKSRTTSLRCHGRTEVPHYEYDAVAGAHGRTEVPHYEYTLVTGATAGLTEVPHYEYDPGRPGVTAGLKSRTYEYAES